MRKLEDFQLIIDKKLHEIESQTQKELSLRTSELFVVHA